MKAIKYLLAGALITVVSAPSMAQDANAQLDAVAKVIKENKSNPEAYEDQVKDYVKENKKNGVALAALGRVFFELRDTANAKKYAEMAVDRGEKEAEGYILLGDIAALNDDGGAAATWYQQATVMDPKEPQGYIKYASVYRKRSPELSVQMLEKLRSIDPSYPVDAEAGHFFYGANKLDKAVEYYAKVDLNQLKDNYLVRCEQRAAQRRYEPYYVLQLHRP